MTHENARAGFKNLFTAEVLFIIATVVDVVGVLLSLIPVVGTIIYGVIEIASVVVVLIAFIMQLVGLSKAGKDEPMVKSAFVASIIALIASAVIPFIGTATDATWRFYLTSIIISLVIAIAAIVVTLIGIVTLGAVLLVALGFFAGICEIVAYIKYVGFLNEARNEV